MQNSSSEMETYEQNHVLVLDIRSDCLAFLRKICEFWSSGDFDL